MKLNVGTKYGVKLQRVGKNDGYANPLPPTPTLRYLFFCYILESWLIPNYGPADTPFPLSLRSDRNFIKGAECAINRAGKIIKKFSDFFFSSYDRKLG